MSDAKTIFKWGCLIALGLLGLVIVVVAATIGLVWTEAQNEVPRTAEAAPAPAEIAAATELVAGLRIVLDLDHVEITIEPVEAERPLRAEATFDERTYAFDETRAPDTGGGTVWTLKFRQTAGLPFAGLRRLLGGTSPRIRIEVPRGVPYSLEGVVRNGALQGDVGGTSLRELDLDASRGAVVLSVREPLAQPMRRFAIDARQGANVIQNLGNASPAEVEISCSMGACVIDLGGAWRNDADLSLDASMAGAVLTLPDDVTLEGLDDVKGFDGLDTPRAEPEVALPTLRFTVDGKWEIR